MCPLSGELFSRLFSIKVLLLPLQVPATLLRGWHLSEFYSSSISPLAAPKSGSLSWSCPKSLRVGARIVPHLLHRLLKFADEVMKSGGDPVGFLVADVFGFHADDKDGEEVLEALLQHVFQVFSEEVAETMLVWVLSMSVCGSHDFALINVCGNVLCLTVPGLCGGAF